ncbi:serine/threonine-protein kinase [Bailinhaonella thermotolerans]|nr:serine/threonine-protein kinase [Bailinhaonella thermotolerans]
MQPQRLPGYVHVRELGSGESGQVVEAVQVATSDKVAIKYLAAGLLGEDRFRREFRLEAQILRALRDRHIVQVLDYYEDDHVAAIVMELVAGASLKDVLAARAPLTPEGALWLLKGSLLGLAHAHARGVVHRDYKPANILITSDGTSKLTDFGIAARTGEHAAPAGTLPYMAPEQFTTTPASPRGDIYSAAAVFFECVTGRRPYPGRTWPELMAQHTSAPIPADAVEPGLRPLITAGLAKHPADRPASATAFLELLDEHARRAYGPHWERRGVSAVGRAAAAVITGAAVTSGVLGALGGGGSVIAWAKMPIVLGTAAVGTAGVIGAAVLIQGQDPPAPAPRATATAAAPAPSRTPAPVITDPARLSAAVETAIAGQRTARVEVTGKIDQSTDQFEATGRLQYLEQATRLDVTVRNPVGEDGTTSPARVVLIGNRARLASGGSRPAAPQDLGSTDGHVRLAMMARWVASPHNLRLLTAHARGFKAAPGGNGTRVYTGQAPVEALASGTPVAQLYAPWAGGGGADVRLAFELATDAEGLPIRLTTTITVGPSGPDAGGIVNTFQARYSGWGSAGPIS